MKALTLKEALKKNCKHRNMELAKKPMENHSYTPDGPHGMPLSFGAE